MTKVTSVLILLLAAICSSASQPNDHSMAVDGKFGLSFFSGGNGSAALLLGGGLDIPLPQEDLFVRPELNITTHTGTPIEIGGVVKYDLPSMQTGNTTLYVDGGFGFWFMSGGPYFGLDFGGGAIFPLQNSKLEIPAEIRFGPIFSSGSSIFQVALTSGIRFDLSAR